MLSDLTTKIVDARFVAYYFYNDGSAARLCCALAECRFAWPLGRRNRPQRGPAMPSVAVGVLCAVLHGIDEGVVILEKGPLHVCDVDGEEQKGDVDYTCRGTDGAYDAERVEGDVLEVERYCRACQDDALHTNSPVSEPPVVAAPSVRVCARLPVFVHRLKPCIILVHPFEAPRVGWGLWQRMSHRDQHKDPI